MRNPPKHTVGITNIVVSKDDPKVLAITDRREAIRKALSLAKKNDVILLSGKKCVGEPQMRLDSAIQNKNGRSSRGSVGRREGRSETVVQRR